MLLQISSVSTLNDREPAQRLKTPIPHHSFRHSSQSSFYETQPDMFWSHQRSFQGWQTAASFFDDSSFSSPQTRNLFSLLIRHINDTITLRATYYISAILKLQFIYLALLSANKRISTNHFHLQIEFCNQVDRKLLVENFFTTHTLVTWQLVLGSGQLGSSFVNYL